MGSLLDNPTLRASVMPISVEQYRDMGEAGVIDERTELLRGVIFQKMNKSPLHGWTVRRLRSLVEPKLPPDCYLRQEEPLSFATSEPEPDLAVVEGSILDHREEHPSVARLVVEVAVTSKEIDSEKASIYAEAGIPEYWLVLPQEKVVKQFTGIEGGCYEHVELIAYGQLLNSTTIPNIAVELSEPL